MTKADLKVKVTELPENRISVEIEVPAARCKSSYDEALSRLGGSIRLPGFRPGKVPKQVILQQIGVARIKAAALEKLIDRAWKEALVQESLEPTSEAEMKEELQTLVDRFSPDQNVTFTLEAEVASKEKEKKE